MRRRHFLGTTLAAGLAARAGAQDQDVKEPAPAAGGVMTFRLAGSPTPADVKETDPGGRLVVEARSYPTQPWAPFPALTEGFYLLIAGGPPPDLAVRVEVVEVAEGGRLSARVDREAAAALKPGQKVALVRPSGSTTAQMKAVPGSVSLKMGEPPAGALSDEAAEKVRDARLAGAKAKSINNLKQIGLALHNYFAVNDRLPPAVVFGPDGKPWHSWRVLLLPYLEQQVLFNEYRFDEPWDGPNNRKLIDRRPDVYREPALGDGDKRSTHYAVVVGAGTAFPPEGARMAAKTDRTFKGPGTRGFADITDGTSNTIAVVPADPGREIPWTKPEDIPFGPEFHGPGQVGGFAAPHEGIDTQGKTVRTAPVLMLDGSVRTVSEWVNPQVLRAALTCSGGEVFSRESLSAGLRNGPAPAPPAPTLVIVNEGGRAQGYLVGP